MSELNREVEVASLAKQLEDKYGNLSNDIESDDEGYYFLNESDSGNPSDEGYSFEMVKVRIEDKDIELLEILGIL